MSAPHSNLHLLLICRIWLVAPVCFPCLLSLLSVFHFSYLPADLSTSVIGKGYVVFTYLTSITTFKMLLNQIYYSYFLIKNHILNII